uniref:Uncharacterized protein n=1 Tax=Picea sitchensis TaxID=3332 RepID=A0A6B9XRA0_PICSI|nr:hypothetical protein Q903MT_gene4162 [Picea sitchensis]
MIQTPSQTVLSNSCSYLVQLDLSHLVLHPIDRSILLSDQAISALPVFKDVPKGQGRESEARQKA